MTLNEAFIANLNHEPIMDTRELALEWLDHIIDCKKKMDVIYEDMFEMNTTNGNENYIYWIALGWFPNELQLYACIDRLAGYLGRKLREEKIKNEYFRYSFQYRGYKVFQVEPERKEAWMA